MTFITTNNELTTRWQPSNINYDDLFLKSQEQKSYFYENNNSCELNGFKEDYGSDFEMLWCDDFYSHDSSGMMTDENWSYNFKEKTLTQLDSNSNPDQDQDQKTYIHTNINTNTNTSTNTNTNITSNSNSSSDSRLKMEQNVEKIPISHQKTDQINSQNDQLNNYPENFNNNNNNQETQREFHNLNNNLMNYDLKKRKSKQNMNLKKKHSLKKIALILKSNQIKKAHKQSYDRGNTETKLFLNKIITNTLETKKQGDVNVNQRGIKQERQNEQERENQQERENEQERGSAKIIKIKEERKDKKKKYVRLKKDLQGSQKKYSLKLDSNLIQNKIQDYIKSHKHSNKNQNDIISTNSTSALPKKSRKRKKSLSVSKNSSKIIKKYRLHIGNNKNNSKSKRKRTHYFKIGITVRNKTTKKSQKIFEKWFSKYNLKKRGPYPDHKTRQKLSKITGTSELKVIRWFGQRRRIEKERWLTGEISKPVWLNEKGKSIKKNNKYKY
ncbi:hypothetical protein M0812_22478 [Anaeramoeba flamelloides]|uniref:Homeobox domain-containing protein n=1 Tax=Anaeramoeba flamelloides TaxID=1746091 RepID=A0AAV7Z014_9EUKA|nr:hypothetical protein M0812_22478 [Anaeramoeba flamelloides]